MEIILGTLLCKCNFLFPVTVFLKINMYNVQDRNLFTFQQYYHFFNVNPLFLVVCLCKCKAIANLSMLQSLWYFLSAALLKCRYPTGTEVFQALRLQQDLYSFLHPPMYFFFESSEKDWVLARKEAVLPLRAKLCYRMIAAVQCDPVWQMESWYT